VAPELGKKRRHQQWWRWGKKKGLGLWRLVAAVKKKGRASGRRMGAGSSASTRQQEADGMAPLPLLANPATTRRGRGGGRC